MSRPTFVIAVLLLQAASVNAGCYDPSSHGFTDAKDMEACCADSSLYWCPDGTAASCGPCASGTGGAAPAEAPAEEESSCCYYFPEHTCGRSRGAPELDTSGAGPCCEENVDNIWTSSSEESITCKTDWDYAPADGEDNRCCYDSAIHTCVEGMEGNKVGCWAKGFFYCHDKNDQTSCEGPPVEDPSCCYFMAEHNCDASYAHEKSRCCEAGGMYCMDPADRTSCGCDDGEGGGGRPGGDHGGHDHDAMHEAMESLMFDTEGEALIAAALIDGCEGAHQMGEKWMPGTNHGDCMPSLDSIDSDSDSDSDDTGATEDAATALNSIDSAGVSLRVVSGGVMMMGVVIGLLL